MTTHRYVPILRWKEGEKNGIRAVLPQDKFGVTPVFVLSSDQYKGKKATKSAIAVASADHFISQVLKAWGSNPFYLDASGILVTPPVSHPILAIAAAARSQGAYLIPATPLGAPAPYAAAVAAIAQHDRRGIALRVDLQEITSAPTWAPSWPHLPGETDLIADFANDIGSVTKFGTMVHSVFQQMHLGSKWRSVTVAGTSMPSNFAGINSGLYTINMETYALWQSLQSIVPYKLDYGDYTTPPLGAVPPDIAWGYPINVRYTIPGQYLICKGVKTTGINAVDMASQLTAHAKSIAGYAHRNQISGCWADDEIDAIANGRSPQNLLHWVKIGVNRHLTLMRRIIP